MKEEEERYTLTFKGLLLLVKDKDLDTQVDAIELYLRRNDCNAIILVESGKFIFDTVELYDAPEVDND